MLRPLLALILFFLIPLHAHAAIFGKDDRTDVTPHSVFSILGRSVAVAVLSANIEPSTTKMGTFKLNTDTLDGLLCPDERFAQDPSLSYSCSGFLVAPDLLVTAGHCQVNTGESRNEPGMYCEAFGWLFGYQRDASGNVSSTWIVE